MQSKSFEVVKTSKTLELQKLLAPFWIPQVISDRSLWTIPTTVKEYCSKLRQMIRREVEEDPTFNANNWLLDKDDPEYQRLRELEFYFPKGTVKLMAS